MQYPIRRRSVFWGVEPVHLAFAEMISPAAQYASPKFVFPEARIPAVGWIVERKRLPESALLFDHAAAMGGHHDPYGSRTFSAGSAAGCGKR